jgi:hypothetical protein
MYSSLHKGTFKLCFYAKGANWHNFSATVLNILMQTSSNDPRRQQPEEGSDKDLNLTNNDASLLRTGERQQPDAPTMTDNAVNVNNDNLTQSASKGSELNPEYGDAADPTFETL